MVVCYPVGEAGARGGPRNYILLPRCMYLVRVRACVICYLAA